MAHIYTSTPPLRIGSLMKFLIFFLFGKILKMDKSLIEPSKKYKRYIIENKKAY